VAKPFNVVLVQPAGYAFSLALAEAAEYVAAMLRTCGHEARVVVNGLRDDAHNVVFCGHLMNRGDVAQLPADTILFNSEPLARQDAWHLGSDVYREALARHRVWDYALRNADAIPHARKDVLPFWYCRDLVRPRPAAASEGRSLLFYGVPTPWRRVLLSEIAAAGVDVQFMHNGFGAQRDAVMWNAWAVLNLHKTEDSAVFEPIRCFYPLINRVPVISEDVQGDAAADAFRDAMFFLPRKEIAGAIRALRDDAAAFRATTSEQFAAFERKSAVEHFRAALDDYFKEIR
jgi:hypothetical protein